MSEKAKVIDKLKAEFKQWENDLAKIPEAKIIAPKAVEHLSIKDVIAHLWGWLQLSIARMEAAVQNKDLEFTLWEKPYDPENVDTINAKIYENNRDRSWSSVYQNWQDDGQRLLDLAEALPEADMLDKQKYEWLEGYAPIDVLIGAYEHHHTDHYPDLETWLNQQAGE